MFGTISDEWLAGLVGWITGDEEKGTVLADIVERLLPAPEEDDFERYPAWLREAWKNSSGPAKSAAYLWLMQHDCWHEEEQGGDRVDDFAALENFARKYAVDVRLCLIEPADQSQIAADLVTLADVLDQGVAEATAAFIIEMIFKARLPVYVVHELFQRVAMVEGGKIKPASFNRLLQVMQPRLKQARRAANNAQSFIRNLEPALAYLNERLTVSDG